MKDIKLIVSEDAENDWFLDINIISGYPEPLKYDRNTQDQRAAVATYMVKGTFPGKPEEGVSWNLMLERDADMTLVDNEIKQNIQNKAGTVGTASQKYVPVYSKTAEGFRVTLLQS